MKTIKKITFISILTIGITQSVFASWWNPFTWNVFKKSVISIQQVQETPITNAENTQINNISNTVTSQRATSTQSDETVNWQTYRNTDIGIEFRYPANRILDTRVHSGLKGKLISISEIREPSLIDFMNAYTVDFTSEEGSRNMQTYEKSLNCSSYVLKPCKEFEIQGHKGVIAYESFGLNGGGFNTIRIVRIKNIGMYPIVEFYTEGPNLSCSPLDDRPIAGCKTTRKDSGPINKKYLANVQTKINKNDFSEKDQDAIKMLDKILATFTFIK